MPTLDERVTTVWTKELQRLADAQTAETARQAAVVQAATVELRKMLKAGLPGIYDDLAPVFVAGTVSGDRVAVYAHSTQYGRLWTLSRVTSEDVKVLDWGTAPQPPAAEVVQATAGRVYGLDDLQRSVLLLLGYAKAGRLGDAP